MSTEPGEILPRSRFVLSLVSRVRRILTYSLCTSVYRLLECKPGNSELSVIPVTLERDNGC